MRLEDMERYISEEICKDNKEITLKVVLGDDERTDFSEELDINFLKEDYLEPTYTILDAFNDGIKRADEGILNEEQFGFDESFKTPRGIILDSLFDSPVTEFFDNQSESGITSMSADLFEQSKACCDTLVVDDNFGKGLSDVTKRFDEEVWKDGFDFEEDIEEDWEDIDLEDDTEEDDGFNFEVEEDIEDDTEDDDFNSYFENDTEEDDTEDDDLEDIDFVKQDVGIEDTLQDNIEVEQENVDFVDLLNKMQKVVDDNERGNNSSAEVDTVNSRQDMDWRDNILEMFSKPEDCAKNREVINKLL